jgi:alpha-ketoglutarate-dependent taurine dioxygenase
VNRSVADDPPVPQQPEGWQGQQVGGAGQQEAHAPLVRHHPETGRKALWVTGAYSIRFGGWTKAQATHFADGGTFDKVYAR